MKIDVKKLLTGINCKCGKRHDCAIRDVILNYGAINKVADLAKGYKKIAVIADNNTYPLCGEKIVNSLKGSVENVLIIHRDGILVPDEKAISEINAVITDNTDLIIGIGSGVIQDLCKYVSFTHNIEYFIVATAPSMDGYASIGSALIIGNMKVTYNAHVPTAIICDTEILKNAPIDMIQSGYGDILGKFSCLNDWKLSHIVNGEYYCDYAYNLTYEMLNSVKDLGAKLLKRDAEAIETLTKALIGVGISMAYVGNSRPASGSEHHMAHYFEIVGLTKAQPYFSHGIDVVYSTVYTQKLREKLLSLNAPRERSLHNPTKWEENVKRIYSTAADGVIALQNKLGWYNVNRNIIYLEKWQEIKAVLQEAPSSDKLIKYLESIGLNISAFEKEYGKEKINDALFYAKDLKDRYSILWTYYDCFIE